MKIRAAIEAARRDRIPAMVWAVSSAGEHYLDMVGAIGSIPIPPTIHNQLIQNSYFFPHLGIELPRFRAILASAPVSVWCEPLVRSR